MAISKDEWKMGYSETNPPKGCNKGCLAIVAVCILIDIAMFWVIWQIVQFVGWLLTIMVSA